MNTQDVKRKLTAILSADVQGYSRMMGQDEIGTIRTLTTYRDAMTNLILLHCGRVVDAPGDNLLAEFASVVDVVQCAVEIQQTLNQRNEKLTDELKMHFRIGINLGDVVEEGNRIFGEGVNIAARMEGLAEKGGICVTKAVYEQVKNKVKVDFVDIGRQQVKNIDDPIRAYQIKPANSVGNKKIADQHQIGTNPPLPDKPSVAVLPFENLTGDNSLEYVSYGIAESIMVALSSLPELFVIDRYSALSFKGTTVSVSQVGQELGVRYVLTGSVLKAGKYIRTTARLVDTTTGYHLWASQYDRDLTDFFDLLDEITQKTIVSLQVHLGQGEQALRVLGTKSFKAWGYYMRASNHFGQFTKINNTKARELFYKAGAADPEFALAWLLAAWTFFVEVRFGFTSSPEASIRKAVELGTKATALDDQLPDVHSFWNTVYMIQGDFERAVAAGKKAIELGPNNATEYVLLSQTLRFAGRFEQAIGYGQKAIRLCPRCPAWYLAVIAPAYIEAGKYDHVISILEDALDRSRKGEIPASHVLQHLAVAYIRLNQEAKAKACALELIESDPDFSLKANSEQLFYKDRELTKSYLNDMRKAGLK